MQVRELNNTAVGDEIDLRELWRALKRRKRVVGATFVAILILSGCYTAYQRIFRPVYEGSFQLLITDPISDENRGATGGGEIVSNSMIESLARNSTKSDIPTLIEVLRSPMLLSTIASRFDTKTAALSNQITIKTGGSKQMEAEGVLTVTLTDREPARASEILKALKTDYLGYSLKQRQQRLNDGLRFLDRQAPALQAKTGELQAQVALFRQKNNQLLPTEEGASQKQKIAGIEDQLRLLQVEELRLLSMRKSIEAGRLTARSFQDNAGGSSGAGGANQGVNVTVANPSLLEQLTKVEEQLAEARAKFRAESPTVRSLTARRDQLLPLLKGKELDAVDAALAMNNTKIAAVQNQEKTLTREFQKQPQLIKQYEALNQKLSIAQENLAGFIKARENFQLEIAQRTVPWQVIAPAEINPNPVKPSIPRNLALGAVLGLVAGAAAGLLRDRMDHVFHHPGEVQQELQLPLLGHIPHVEFFAGVREEKRFLLEELDSLGSANDKSTTAADAQAKNAEFTGYQRFFYQEAFRNLFSSLRFLNSDRPIRSIAITSSLPTEGKSLVNILLAKTISEMGQRVLLIDADLRKPQLHHRLGQDNIQGLSNLLTDDGNLHWRQAIQPVKGRDNWSVITAGRRPPDPARLLSSHRMGALINDLANSGEFDLIIYDTPPVLGLADAMLVAEHLDGIILLVSLARVDRGLPKESIQRICTAGAPLLGIVTNAVKKESRSASAYGYGYGYGYGKYGYGAYDAGHAYNYYSNDDSNISGAKVAEDKSSVNGKNGQQTATNLKRKIMGWLDG
ncbi:GumC family protein [Synechococcus lacustris]|uniref:GumC family protein n=1 Tax=Synechococcus lacustris TaxID=2116544 RepID=UPI0020CD81F9|nr:polysaccharide biosynthesis tyrosine autokinase [Synechococcus lacustris]